MMAIAAAQMGYRCHIYAPEQTSVAAQVSARFTCAGWYDDARWQFVWRCDVITFEFENVPVDHSWSTFPKVSSCRIPRALETAQDRVAEKGRYRTGRSACSLRLLPNPKIPQRSRQSARPASSKPAATAMMARANGGSIPIRT
jgi:phosphoribosylaminoimidazole carboxylase (NCAIR synthetase)